MKKVIVIILCLHLFGKVHSQGITLLYTGGQGNLGDTIDWIQINTPPGQTPIQRIPTADDDVVFNKTLSGISSVFFSFRGDSANIGGGNSPWCRSMHISNTYVEFINISYQDEGAFINVYTTNGGSVIIDSGSVIQKGIFHLYGGNPAITDLQVKHSKLGYSTTHNTNWVELNMDNNAKASFMGSSFEGDVFGSINKGSGLYASGTSLYADSSTFSATIFTLGDHSADTILNSTINPDQNNYDLYFLIGRNSNFISANANILVTRYSTLNFTTSGSVFNGNVSSNYFNFLQEDPANPLPNIINGDVFMLENPSSGISGDVKISGNFTNYMPPIGFDTDTSNVFINGQHVFEIGGIKNFGNNVSITNCAEDYCHYKMEFFGNTNSNINWGVGFPVDTLIINKTGCAKVTVTNSLYVAGSAEIKSGQLALDPNDTIPYKFVCAGDLHIYDGGGVFLRKDSNGVVANMAIEGNIYDDNLTTDSTCAGFSNPYKGNLTLYRNNQNDGTHLIDIASNSNIGNINLTGQPGSDFILGTDLAVNNFNFTNTAKLSLGDHKLIVNGNISNYGQDRYFVTDGLGKLQVNNVGNVATVFPVGSSTSSYNPVTITNTGTPDNFSVNVQPQVLSGGSNGNPYTTGVVNRTWNIEESNPGGSIAIVSLEWKSEDELSGFNRNTSYISHYVSGAWDNVTTMLAGGADPYRITRTNITSFSPFAVMSPANGSFSIFPNPVKDKLFINLPNASVESVLRIVDMKGVTVMNLKLAAGTANTTITTSDLPAGVYSIIIDSGISKETKKFVKE